MYKKYEKQIHKQSDKQKQLNSKCKQESKTKQFGKSPKRDPNPQNSSTEKFHPDNTHKQSKSNLFILDKYRSIHEIAQQQKQDKRFFSVFKGCNNLEKLVQRCKSVFMLPGHTQVIKNNSVQLLNPFILFTMNVVEFYNFVRKQSIEMFKKELAIEEKMRFIWEIFRLVKRQCQEVEVEVGWGLGLGLKDKREKDKRNQKQIKKNQKNMKNHQKEFKKNQKYLKKNQKDMKKNNVKEQRPNPHQPQSTFLSIPIITYISLKLAIHFMFLNSLQFIGYNISSAQILQENSHQNNQKNEQINEYLRVLEDNQYVKQKQQHLLYRIKEERIYGLDDVKKQVKEEYIKASNMKITQQQKSKLSLSFSFYQPLSFLSFDTTSLMRLRYLSSRSCSILNSKQQNELIRLKQQQFVHRHVNIKRFPDFDYEKMSHFNHREKRLLEKWVKAQYSHHKINGSSKDWHQNNLHFIKKNSEPANKLHDQNDIKTNLNLLFPSLKKLSEQTNRKNSNSIQQAFGNSFHGNYQKKKQSNQQNSVQPYAQFFQNLFQGLKKINQ